MTSTDTSRLVRLIGSIALFVLVGTPMVAYLWETMNVLLTGRVEPVKLGIAVIVLGIFAGLLMLLSRSIHALEGRRDARSGATPPADHLPPPPHSRRSS